MMPLGGSPYKRKKKKKSLTSQAPAGVTSKLGQKPLKNTNTGRLPQSTRYTKDSEGGSIVRYGGLPAGTKGKEAGGGQTEFKTPTNVRKHRGIKILYNQDTGERSGLIMPDGRKFVGIDQRMIDTLLSKNQGRYIDAPISYEGDIKRMRAEQEMEETGRQEAFERAELVGGFRDISPEEQNRIDKASETFGTRGMDKQAFGEIAKKSIAQQAAAGVAGGGLFGGPLGALALGAGGVVTGTTSAVFQSYEKKSIDNVDNAMTDFSSAASILDTLQEAVRQASTNEEKAMLLAEAHEAEIVIHESHATVMAAIEDPNEYKTQAGKKARQIRAYIDVQLETRMTKIRLAALAETPPQTAASAIYNQQQQQEEDFI